MLDLDNLLVSLAKDSRKLQQFEKEPMVVLANTFGDNKQFVEKYWGKDTNVSVAKMKNLEDEIRGVVTRSKIGEAGPVAILPLAAAAGALVFAYAVCANAAKTLSPFTYSEHNLQLSEDKIRELLEKGIIKREDIVQGGHKGI